MVVLITREESFDYTDWYTDHILAQTADKIDNDILCQLSLFIS